MPDFNELTLKVLANRGGTISEITSFLGDLDNAYLALYQFEAFWPASIRRWKGPMPLRFYEEFGFPFHQISLHQLPLASVSVLPEQRLAVTRIQIASQGFWEVLGSLNPLQQIREYLNDRHERRQDIEFREAAEKEKLRLENELIQRTIWEKDNAVLRDRITVLRELGYSNQEIRQLIWAQAGHSLAMLGRHQDSGLIEGAT